MDRDHTVIPHLRAYLAPDLAINLATLLQPDCLVLDQDRTVILHLRAYLDLGLATNLATLHQLDCLVSDQDQDHIVTPVHQLAFPVRIHPYGQDRQDTDLLLQVEVTRIQADQITTTDLMIRPINQQIHITQTQVTGRTVITLDRMYLIVLTILLPNMCTSRNTETLEADTVIY